MQADFKVNMRAWWSKDGRFEIFKTTEIIGNTPDGKQEDISSEQGRILISLASLLSSYWYHTVGAKKTAFVITSFEDFFL
jgi:hypothetical protein